MTRPTTRRTKLARRLGCDGNPLRRRCDRIAAWLVPAAIVAFLALCPLVVAVTTSWVRSDNAAIQRAESSWHPVRAVLLQSVPPRNYADYGSNVLLTAIPARWTADGRSRTGEIPVRAGSMAGSYVTVWLDRAGDVRSAPLTKSEAGGRVVEGAVCAAVILALVLTGMTLLGRWLLDLRRIASWGWAWLSVGPTWSRHRLGTWSAEATARPLISALAG